MSLVVASAVLCLNLFAAPPQASAKPGPRENVATALVEAIRLMEAKDYRTFLTQFVPPDQIKARAGTPEALNALIESLGARADRLLAALKFASTQTPAYDEARTTATFQMDGQAGGPPTLRFVKIGQYWYIGDR